MVLMAAAAAVVLLVAVLIFAGRNSEPVETTAPTETTVPVETTAPTQTTAPVETTTPAETTEPVQTTESALTTAPGDTTPGETQAPKPQSGTTVIRLAAAGDLNVTDYMLDNAAHENGYDFSQTFLDVAPILSGADLTLLNFEGDAMAGTLTLPGADGGALEGHFERLHWQRQPAAAAAGNGPAWLDSVGEDDVPF